MQTLSVNDAQLVDEIESALIAWFNPPLNKTQIKGKGYIAVRKVIDVKISGLGDRIRQVREAEYGLKS